MPKILNVRLVNIQLDDGKKIIADQIFPLSGKNVLFLLPNGGGKTSLIQLLMQTVLPNSKLAGRDIRKTLLSQTNGYVLTEWELDGTNPKYLCNGFAFLNSGLGYPLFYFNFYFTYNERDSYNISNLPFFEKGKIMNINNAKKFLREEVKATVNDTNNKMYKQALERFSVLSNEWESMQKINGAEGGVEQFFLKTKTSEDLLKKLIIPELERIIYRNENGKDELFETYLKYKDTIIELPIYEKNLREYEKINKNSVDFLEAVETYDKTKNEFNEKYNEISTLYFTFIELEKIVKENVKNKINSIQNLQEKIRVSEWKIDSYEAYKVKNLIQQERSKCLEMEKKKQELENDREILNEELKRLESIDFFNDFLEQNEKAQKLKQKIDETEKTNEELTEILNKKRKEFEKVWKSRYKTILDELKKLQEEKDELIENKKNIEKIKKATEHDIRETSKQLGKRQEFKTNYDSEIDELSNSFSLEELKNIEKTISDFERDVEKKSQQESKFETEKQTKNTDGKDLSLKKEILIEKKNDKKNNLKSIEEKLNEYNDNFKELTEIISTEFMKNYDLYKDKEIIKIGLNSKLDNLKKEMAKYSIEIEHLEKLLKKLDIYDFYIPNDELIKLQAKLEDKGIYVMLGSYWLTNQPEEEKDKLLINNPALPFALLVDNKQLTEVKNALKVIKNLEIPVVLIVKEYIEKKEKTNEIITNLDQKTLIYQSIELDFFSSVDKNNKLNKLKSDTEKRISDFQNIIEKYKQQETILSERIQRLNILFQTYDEDFEKINKNTLTELKKEIKNIETEITINSDKNSELEKKIVVLEKDIKENQKEINNIKQKIQHLQYFHKRYKNINEVLKEIKGLNEKLENSDSTKMEAEKLLEEINKKMTDQEKQISFKDTELKVHKNEGREFSLVITENILERIDNIEYNRIKISYEQTKNNIEKGFGDYEQTVDFYENIVGQIKKLETEINLRSVTFDWLKTNRRIVADTELQDKKLGLEQNMQLWESEVSQMNEVERNIAKSEGSLEKIQENIKEKYLKEEFLYDEEANIQFKQFKKNNKELKEKLSDLESEHKEMEDYVKGLGETIELIEEHKIKFIIRNDTKMFKEEFWKESYGKTAKSAYKNLIKQLENVQEKMHNEKRNADKLYEEYINKLKEQNNTKIIEFTRNLSEILNTEKFYDFHYIKQKFKEIDNITKQLQKQLIVLKEEVEKNKEEIVDICLNRLKTIYENVLEIPKLSKVEMNDSTIHLIKIDWEKPKREDEKSDLRLYIHELLEHTKEKNEENIEKSELEEFIRQRLTTESLLESYAPVSKGKFRVRIIKPRMDELWDKNKYENWEEAADWSGGEGYSVYMTMFMVLISFIRQKKFSSIHQTKFILADNPFGKASSDHVVAPIIKIAEKLNIQLLCLTAIQETNIHKHFDVIISNTYNAKGGKAFMKSEVKNKNLQQVRYEVIDDTEE